MKNDSKKILQGMEHLKNEITDSSSEIINIHESSHKIIRMELLQIIIIMILLFGTIFALVITNNQNNFLSDLAVTIDNWI